MGNKHGRSHIDFWLGSRLDLPSLSSTYHHLLKRNGRAVDSTPPLYKFAFSIVSNCKTDGFFEPSDIDTITTKDLYTCFLDELPVPVIE